MVNFVNPTIGVIVLLVLLVLALVYIYWLNQQIHYIHSALINRKILLRVFRDYSDTFQLSNEDINSEIINRRRSDLSETASVSTELFLNFEKSYHISGNYDIGTPEWRNVRNSLKNIAGRLSVVFDKPIAPIENNLLYWLDYLEQRKKASNSESIYLYQNKINDSLENVVNALIY